MRWENDEKLENKDANVGIHGAGGLPDIGRGLSGRLLLQLQGQVFANAQTGNLVLLGQNLAMGNWPAALHYVIPLAAFLSGVYVTEWVHQRCRDYRKIHWRQIVLLVEVLLLAAVGLMPQLVNMLANACLSFACAMQVNSFRKFKGLPFATTMCIGNMRSATAMSVNSV